MNEALQKEQALSAAQKEFIHLVSHEFRTPIAIISGAAQLLAAKAPQLHQAEGAPQFRKINEALSRLEGLLDNVLRLSMAEEGKEVFAPASFELTASIYHVIEWFDGARIRCDIGHQPIMFYGDQRLLEYALHNIISNGLKYSPPTAQIAVQLTILPRGIEISVRDEGAGMSADTISRIGEKFYRDIKTSHIGGTGLGLHLARRFVEYHKGDLKFDSHVGKGTTVRLFLPQAMAMESVA